MKSYASDKKRTHTEPECALHVQLRNTMSAVPFVDLRVPFDPKPIVAEMRLIKHLLVGHRAKIGGKPTKGWFALNLKGLHGNAELTRSTRHYQSLISTIRDVPNAYRLTLIAQQCPKTLALLRSIVRLKDCSRVRILALAPGGHIPPHRDQRNFGTVLHASVVEPSDCTFWIAPSRGNSTSAHLIRVPFVSGSFFLVDVSRCHTVSNRSRRWRYHLVVEGPVKAHALRHALVFSRGMKCAEP